MVAFSVALNVTLSDPDWEEYHPVLLTRAHLPSQFYHATSCVRNN